VHPSDEGCYYTRLQICLFIHVIIQNQGPPN